MIKIQQQRQLIATEKLVKIKLGGHKKFHGLLKIVCFFLIQLLTNSAIV